MRPQAHRGAYLRHLAVSSRVDHLIVTGKSEVAHQPHFFGQRVVICHHRAALETVDEFRRVKTEDLARAKAADGSTATGTTKRVSGVIHDFQLPAASDVLNGLSFTRPSPEVDSDDSAGARRDQALDASRIEVMRPRVHVREDGSNLLPLQRMGGGDESVSGHDDFAAQL